MRHPSQLSDRGQAGETLAQFFHRESADKSESTRNRYRRVREQLMRCLDQADMSGCLDAHETAVLASARRDGRSFLDVFGLEEVIVCIPRFLSSDWLLGSITDARAQVMLSGRLIEWLDTRGLNHRLLGGALYEAQGVVRATRAALRTGRDAPTVTPPRPVGPVAAGAPRPVLTLIHGGRPQR